MKHFFSRVRASHPRYPTNFPPFNFAIYFPRRDFRTFIGAVERVADAEKDGESKKSCCNCLRCKYVETERSLNWSCWPRALVFYFRLIANLLFRIPRIVSPCYQNSNRENLLRNSIAIYWKLIFQLRWIKIKYMRNWSEYCICCTLCILCIRIQNIVHIIHISHSEDSSSLSKLDTPEI